MFQSRACQRLSSKGMEKTLRPQIASHKMFTTCLCQQELKCCHWRSNQQREGPCEVGRKGRDLFFSPHFQSRLKVCLCRVENVISNISLSAKWYHAGSTTAGEEKKNLRPVVSLMESVPTLARFCMTTGALKIHLQRRPVSRCHDILSVLLHVLIEAFR